MRLENPDPPITFHQVPGAGCPRSGWGVAMRHQRGAQLPPVIGTRATPHCRLDADEDTNGTSEAWANPIRASSRVSWRYYERIAVARYQVWSPCTVWSASSQAGWRCRRLPRTRDMRRVRARAQGANQPTDEMTCPFEGSRITTCLVRVELCPITVPLAGLRTTIRCRAGGEGATFRVA